MNRTKPPATGKLSAAAKPKSSTADTAGGAARAEQASNQFKGAVGHRRINVQMIQNVLLIWLDNNIDENSTDCRNTIAQLQRAVNSVNTFTDSDQCVEFIDNIGDEKACMIISGALGQHILPRVHDMYQVNSIFIFCGNQKYHQQWTKEWPKIKGVFTEITPICEALKQAAHQCEQNSISMSFVATIDDNSKKNLDQLDCSFMYTQILKEILLTIEFKPKHFTELIKYCRDVFAKNRDELKNVKQLERKYRDKTHIWWYTYDSFLYPMLNRVLRIMDVDIIIELGFFINDLHCHIEELHKEQFAGQKSSEIFKVYRGQGMSKGEFEQMSTIKGGLIAFNNFLSTSKNCKISLNYANSIATNPDVVGILFAMTINPKKSTAPFASIVNVSYFKEKEDEVPFAMHTVFRIKDITPMSENRRLFQVELTLTDDNDKDLRQLTNRIREETEGSTGWDQLGALLFRMGQAKKAEQVYQTLLEQLTEEKEKARVYDQLGRAKAYLGEYSEAIILTEKALEIKQQSLPPNHPDLTISYNNIGNVYYRMGEYSKALLSYEKSFEIKQQSLPPNHPDLAMSYNNIGVVYDSMGEYLKALSSYEKALEIQQQSLSPNHPDLAMSYNNIDAVYYSTDEYSKALSSYEKSLEIRQQSLPPNHPAWASSYNNIGSVYYCMREYLKALSFYEKALEIQELSLSPNHPDLASAYNNIGLVYENMGEFSKAKSFYEHAVDIGQLSLPTNPAELQKRREHLYRVKKKL